MSFLVNYLRITNKNITYIFISHPLYNKEYFTLLKKLFSFNKALKNEFKNIFYYKKVYFIDY